mgnify:CR=1 FL=1
MSCTICGDTGEAFRYGSLDCAAPGCTAAVERAALNDAVAASEPLSEYDLQWLAYQLGKAAAGKTTGEKA